MNTLEIKKTQIPFSTFLEKRDQALFAKIEFKTDDYVTPFGHKINQMMNDGLFDLSPFVDTNNEHLEKAFVDAENSYYDSEKASKVVNVVLSTDPVLRTSHYKAIKHINVGDELIRCYGFNTWIREIAEIGILSTHNIVGFLNYVSELYQTMPRNDPYYEYCRGFV